MERYKQVTKKDLDHLATKDDLKELNDRFDKVDNRFNKVDGRFSKVDDRFDKVDNRFNKVDGSFSKVDDRFDKVESNIQSDIRHLGELIMKVISNLPDKAYLDDRIADAMGENTVKRKKIVKASKHITAVVGRHHNKIKMDNKDIAVAKEVLSSI